MIGILNKKKTAPLLFSHVDEDSGDSTPIVIGSYDEEQLTEELLKYPAGLFSELEVDLSGQLYHLALRSDWRLLEGEERKRSKKSHAKYSAALIVGRYAWLIQVISPRRFWWAWTSHHRHWWKWESWHWIAGAHPIVSNGTGKQVLEGSCSAPPCFFHQLGMRVAFFRLIPALVLLKIFDSQPGEPAPLGMDDYDYA